MSPDADSSNRRRLQVLLETFAIPHSAVAKAGKVSPAFISRLLSPTDKLTGSSDFWMRVEQAIPSLLEQRRAQIFDIPATPIDRIEGLQAISDRQR